MRFGDLDANRHLNNVVFLRYFESARIAFIRTLLPAHDPAAPEALGTGLIFAECTIRYRAPVWFDELVEVTCTIGEVRRSAFEVPFQMHVGEKLVAEGSGLARRLRLRAGPRSAPAGGAARCSRSGSDALDQRAGAEAAAAAHRHEADLLVLVLERVQERRDAGGRRWSPAGGRGPSRRRGC